MTTPTFTCKVCGTVAARTGPTQRYCEPCSARRDIERKGLWRRTHPRSHVQLQRERDRQARARPLVRDAGADASVENRRGLSWAACDGPDLLWLVRVKVPFSYATSKNHIYTMRAAGHVALRREATQIRAAIAAALRRSLQQQPVAHNKLWIDILVQKPDHRGDAVNVIDLVCDAIKDGVGLDDRWFSIRRLDWEIVKRDPELVIGVGQDSAVDCQICSHCGRAKPLSDFTKRKGSRLGIGRACRECLRMGRRLARAATEAP